MMLAELAGAKGGQGGPRGDSAAHHGGGASAEAGVRQTAQPRAGHLAVRGGATRGAGTRGGAAGTPALGMSSARPPRVPARHWRQAASPEMPEIAWIRLSSVTSSAVNSRMISPWYIATIRSETCRTSGISEEITMTA